MAHHLLFRQRRTKSFARLHMFTGPTQTRLHGTHGRHGHEQAFLGQLVHQISEALALLAQQAVGGHPHSVKKQLRGVLGMHTQFFQIAPTGKAWACGVDQKQTHATGAQLGLGFGRDHHQVSQLPVGDEYFLALDQVAPVVRRGAGADVGQVTARARFGHANGRYHLTTGHAWQPCLLLLGRAVMVQIRGHNF